MAHALAHLQLLEQRHDGVAGLAGHGHGGATGRRVVDAVGVHGAGEQQQQAAFIFIMASMYFSLSKSYVVCIRGAIYGARIESAANI